MIEFIFTIDYEIYGNGSGSLKQHVYEPAVKLKEIFQKHGKRFVCFVEAAELEMIEKFCTDPDIQAVRRQVRELYRQGYEIGLHLHPQWYNGRYENKTWHLDEREYNLCVLSTERITHIVNRSIAYLRNFVEDKTFTPVSFRAGNWLLQPTERAARALSDAGIRIDSSVFKGGLQRMHRLDYRPALKNGYYWSFESDINESDPAGRLIEIPTYTRMVPFWTMLTAKRVGLQQRTPASSGNGTGPNRKIKRVIDYARLRYPLKLDFCRMTVQEMISMVEKVIEEDVNAPSQYRPLVAIGHTKDLFDFDAVESLLLYLKKNKIAVTTFRNVYETRFRPQELQSMKKRQLQPLSREA